VGYAMGERLSKNLVEESLLRAVLLRPPEKEILHHSDRGVQYCSGEYRRLLKRFGLVVSMSGKGNCYDNAPMESFWAFSNRNWCTTVITALGGKRWLR